MLLHPLRFNNLEGPSTSSSPRGGGTKREREKKEEEPLTFPSDHGYRIVRKETGETRERKK